MFNYLQMGSFGNAVRELQAMLNTLPSNLQPLKEDSQFGPKTYGRVVEFQGQNNLKPDGVVGPLTFEGLEEAVKLILQFAISPADEAAAREAIANIARAHLAQWGGVWDPNTDKPGLTQKIAGKICIDEITRLRQGGPQIALFFSTMAVPNSQKCLTISKEAVEMYGRSYTANERNNTDIPSWCGIFAFYIYKIAGLKKIPAWSAIKVYGVSTERVNGVPKQVPKERCQMKTTTKPQKGDIGIVGARPILDSNGKVIVPIGQNHHFIVTDVNGGSVSSIDGNSGARMEILSNNYTISEVIKTGGFYTPIWENCM